ncbi:MAG: hypothetical protein QXE73_05470 [Candidatus Bathyarchaeia archaeon]
MLAREQQFNLIVKGLSDLMDKLVMGSHFSGCRLVEQGFKPDACLTYCDGEWKPACKATLARRNNTPYRLIHSYTHKSPEQYLSIYQSGCN